MESAILSTADARSTLERFRSAVCELLCLPAHVGESELRAALKRQGEESLRWYEDRRKAIGNHFASRLQIRADVVPAAAH